MTSGGVMSLADPIRIPQYSADEIRAVTDEAARRGSYVAAHAYSPEAIRHSIDNGVRSIEHGNLLDAQTATAMASAGAFLVPTLAAYDAMERRGEQIGMPAVSRHKNREVLESGQQAIELARAAGVSVGFGTDLMGPLEDEQLNGLRLQAEVDGIWTVLASATSVNAELIGRPDLGQVAEGCTADLLILAGNIRDDPSVLWSPHSHRTIVQDGRVITNSKTASLADARRPAIRYWNNPFGPVRWRHAERRFLSCGCLLANARSWPGPCGDAGAAWRAGAAARCGAGSGAGNRRAQARRGDAGSGQRRRRAISGGPVASAVAASGRCRQMSSSWWTSW
jgi:Amidohydrolase family